MIFITPLVVLLTAAYLRAVKKAIAIFALLGLLVQVLTVPFLAFRLESQRDVIALTKCENLDKPQLQCAGSCYISDQLADAFEQDQSNGTSTAVSQSVSLPPFSTPPQFAWQLSQPTNEDVNPCFGITAWKHRLFTNSAWHPPRV